MGLSGLRIVAILTGAAWPLCAQAPGADFFDPRAFVTGKELYACHTRSELGGLRADSRERLLRGGNGLASWYGCPVRMESFRE
jgi:hypothetical protein